MRAVHLSQDSNTDHICLGKREVGTIGTEAEMEFTFKLNDVGG
jgi:hypothetical protein